MNLVVLVGRAGKDSDTKQTPSGVDVNKFSLATNRSYQKNGEWQQDTEWHNIVQFGKFITPVEKGELVQVQGRIHYNQYEKDGVKMMHVDVIADKVSRLVKNEATKTDGYVDLGANDNSVPF